MRTLLTWTTIGLLFVAAQGADIPIMTGWIRKPYEPLVSGRSGITRKEAEFVSYKAPGLDLDTQLPQEEISKYTHEVLSKFGPAEEQTYASYIRDLKGYGAYGYLDGYPLYPVFIKVVKGPPGPPGRPGKRGPPGPKGQSTKEVRDAVLKELVLPAGPPGPHGEKGDTGPQGEKGEKGDKGDKGDQGEKGEKGDKGDTGPRGLKGDRGAAAPNRFVSHASSHVKPSRKEKIPAKDNDYYDNVPWYPRYFRTGNSNDENLDSKESSEVGSDDSNDNQQQAEDIQEDDEQTDSNISSDTLPVEQTVAVEESSTDGSEIVMESQMLQLKL